MATGDWWRHGVFYQVYPRSFQDANGDGIGDLPGITSRLDYLNDGTPDSLGVDAIWLSPCYPSPMADFGYDVSDYCDIHPDYGTLADFDELLRAAHARGIRVLLDFVPNHTSDQHPWFLESRAGRASPKRDWYVWRDPQPDGSPPNNWRSIFARVGSAWTLDPASRQYYLHSFLPEQPDLEWWNPQVREAMAGVLRFWLDRGVDGFRIDVAHKMSRDPELRDNPPEALVHPMRAPEGSPSRVVRRYDEDWPEVHRILHEFRGLLDRYDDRMAVGEVGIVDPVRLMDYYGPALDELHLAFNFAFLAQPWRARAFRDATDLYEALLPRGAWPVYTLSNHDNSRSRSRYDGGDPARGARRARVAAMLLLTLRGTPFLYFGEEIGQADGLVPPDRVVDVDGRDPERTPMQWAPGPGAGFTTGDPWLPIGPEADRVNVERQRDDPASILSLYRRLIWYRRSSAALRWGSYRAIDAGEDLFVYEREAGSDRRLVVLNFGAEPRALEVPGRILPLHGVLELSTVPDRAPGPVSLASLEVGPDEGIVVRA